MTHPFDYIYAGLVFFVLVPAVLWYVWWVCFRAVPEMRRTAEEMNQSTAETWQQLNRERALRNQPPHPDSVKFFREHRELQNYDR